MPHDRSGTPLKAGDYVLLPCVVKSISQGEKDCNVTLEAVAHPDESYKPTIACNSKLVKLDMDARQNFDQDEG